MPSPTARTQRATSFRNTVQTPPFCSFTVTSPGSPRMGNSHSSLPKSCQDKYEQIQLPKNQVAHIYTAHTDTHKEKPQPTQPALKLAGNQGLQHNSGEKDTDCMKEGSGQQLPGQSLTFYREVYTLPKNLKKLFQTKIIGCLGICGALTLLPDQ